MIGSLPLTPDFDPAVTAYSAKTTNQTDAVEAAAWQGTVAIAVNGKTLDIGDEALWDMDGNTVTVTVVNGAAASTYTVAVTRYASTTWSADPGVDGVPTGGADAVFAFDGNTSTVTGTIDFYPEDLALERPPGCRVGFQFTAPEDLTEEDCADAVYSQNDDPMRPLTEYANLSGRDNVFWWYPLVTKATQVHTLALQWSPDRPVELFAVSVDGAELKEET